MQTKLDEEESKNMKLQQQINKLEHHSAQIQEVREQYNVGLYLSVSVKVLSTALELLHHSARSETLHAF